MLGRHDDRRPVEQRDDDTPLPTTLARPLLIGLPA